MVVITDEISGGYNTNSITRAINQFQTTMPKSNFYDYRDGYMFDKEIIVIVRPEANAVAQVKDRINHKVIFKYLVSFTGCISKTNDKMQTIQKILMLRCQCIIY